MTLQKGKKPYMKKLTLLLYITLACCLFACEREIIDPPPFPFFEDEMPTPPPLMILYPNTVESPSGPECVYESVDMDIERVEAFNSTILPEVILTITGGHHNGNVIGIDSRAYYQVDGRTITVWATKRVGQCAGPDIVTPIGMALYIGTLETGEYKVVSQSGEQLLTFHTKDLEDITFYNCYPEGQRVPYLVPGDANLWDCPQQL